MQKCKLIYVKGGRNSGKHHSISWDANGLPARGTPALETYLIGAADALTPLLTDDMEVIRATCMEPVAPGSGPAKRPVTVDLKEKKGKVATTAQDNTATLEHVLIFKKKAGLGFGAIEIRGALKESDLDTNEEGALIIKANTAQSRITTFETAFFNATKGGEGAGMILPQKEGEAVREVTKIIFDKVGLSQESIQRVSPEQQLNDAVKGLMSKLNSEYVDAKYSRSTGATNNLTPSQTADFNLQAKEILKHKTINQLGKLGIPKPIQALMKDNS